MQGDLKYAILTFGKNGIVLGSVFRQKVHLLCTYCTIINSIVGRSIASISDLGGIFTSALCASVNMSPRSDISAIDLPTVLYILLLLLLFQCIMYKKYTRANCPMQHCSIHKKYIFIMSLDHQTTQIQASTNQGRLGMETDDKYLIYYINLHLILLPGAHSDTYFVHACCDQQPVFVILVYWCAYIYMCVCSSLYKLHIPWTIVINHMNINCEDLCVEASFNWKM